MLDLTRHPRLLQLVSLWDRAAGVVRRWRARGGPSADPLLRLYEQVWSEAAEALGATLHPLGCGAYEIRQGPACARVLGAATALDSLATHRIVRYKSAAYRLLQEQGLPTPRFAGFSLANLKPAVDFLQSVGGECVVKPGDGAGGGRGITTGIRSRWQLARAACLASAHGRELLIEEQVAGDNYRLLYLDGQLLDAVLRRPPTVAGDGRSSVAQLVHAANAVRARPGPGLSHAALTIDLEMRWVLAGQGYRLSSVPPPGVSVLLKRVTNESGARSNVPASNVLCKAIVAEGARAAAALGVRLAGVDVLAPAPNVSLRESGGAILEVSTCPGFFWHYHRCGQPAAVAIPILRCLLSEQDGMGVLPAHAPSAQQRPFSH